MGLAYTRDSEYAKERVKWEAQHTELGPPGRPFVYHEYPKRLYRAGRNGSGVPQIVEALTAESPEAERNLLSRGFHAGQDVALEALHASDREIATLSAERAYTDRRMSAQAQAEAAAADDATAHHVPSIPERHRPPRRKPGPTPKGASHAEV